MKAYLSNQFTVNDAQIYNSNLTESGTKRKTNGQANFFSHSNTQQIASANLKIISNKLNSSTHGPSKSDVYVNSNEMS